MPLRAARTCLILSTLVATVALTALPSGARAQAPDPDSFLFRYHINDPGDTLPNENGLGPFGSTTIGAGEQIDLFNPPSAGGTRRTSAVCSRTPSGSGRPSGGGSTPTATGRSRCACREMASGPSWRSCPSSAMGTRTLARASTYASTAATSRTRRISTIRRGSQPGARTRSKLGA